MTTQQLKCFVEVANTLSYATAAKHLFITQPAVSNQIISLEKELGFCLFNRSRHHVELTVAGTVFYPGVVDLLERLSIVVAQAKDSSDSYSSELRIGYSQSIGIAHLPDIFRKYRKKLPGIHIINRELQNRNWYLDSMINTMDIFFLSEESDEIPSAFQYRSLYKGSFVCVVPYDSPLASLSSITCDNLKNQTLILLDQIHCPTKMNLLQVYIQSRCKETKYYYSGSSTHTIPMILGGMGIAVMPDFSFQETEKIKAIPFECPYSTEYGIAWYKGNTSEKIREFVKITRESYK